MFLKTEVERIVKIFLCANPEVMEGGMTVQGFLTDLVALKNCTEVF